MLHTYTIVFKFQANGIYAIRVVSKPWIGIHIVNRRSNSHGAMAGNRNLLFLDNNLLPIVELSFLDILPETSRFLQLFGFS